jgi:hypothetical protein
MRTADGVMDWADQFQELGRNLQELLENVMSVVGIDAPASVLQALLVGLITVPLLIAFCLLWNSARQIAAEVTYKRHDRVNHFLDGEWHGPVAAIGFAFLSTWVALYLLLKRNLLVSYNDSVGWAGSILFWPGLFLALIPLARFETAESGRAAQFGPDSAPPEAAGPPTATTPGSNLPEPYRSFIAKYEPKQARNSAPQRERPFWLLVFSIASGSLSVINLVRRWLVIGLHGILADLVAYYQKITHGLLDFIVWPLPFVLPPLYKDLFALSFLMYLGLGRAIEREEAVQIEKRLATCSANFSSAKVWADRAKYLIASFFKSIPLLGLGMFAISLLDIVRAATGHLVTHRRVYIAAHTVFSFLCMCAVAIMFFALNKYTTD